MQLMTRPAYQFAPMVDLDTWRKRENLTWPALADLVTGPDPAHPAVPVTAQTLRKYGLGMLWPDPDLIERIAVITGGEVTVASLHMKRAEWLKAHGRPRRVRIHE